MNGRLRTSWLRFRIVLAHLRPRFMVSWLVVAAGILIATLGPARILSTWREDGPPPKPAPIALPTPPPLLPPTRVVTRPVIRPPTPKRTTRPPTPVATTSPTPRVTTPPPKPRAPRVRPPKPRPPAPPTTIPPTSARPTPTPAAIEVELDAATDVGDTTFCDDGVDITVIGTVSVDQAATVTYRWDPEPPGGDSSSLTFPDADWDTVAETTTVYGHPGDVLEGSMTLIASADGARTATTTASYSINCI